MLKSGFLTSEFAVSVGALIVTALVTFKVLSAENVETVNAAIVQTVEAVSLVVMNAIVAWKFISSRTELKKEVLIQNSTQK